MAIVKLTAPWITYYRELNELFKEDPEVRVIYDDEENEVRLYVDNQEKAEALKELLPVEMDFGNVTLVITVIPSNSFRKSAKQASIIKAFENNPIVNGIKIVSGIMTNDLVYIIFRKEVVQYFNDDLGDINGLCSTLYQDIAKRVFKEIDGVCFCTDKSKSIKVETASISSYLTNNCYNAK